MSLFSLWLEGGVHWSERITPDNPNPIGLTIRSRKSHAIYESFFIKNAYQCLNSNTLPWAMSSWPISALKNVIDPYVIETRNVIGLVVTLLSSLVHFSICDDTFSYPYGSIRNILFPYSIYYENMSNMNFSSGNKRMLISCRIWTNID